MDLECIVCKKNKNILEIVIIKFIYYMIIMNICIYVNQLNIYLILYVIDFKLNIFKIVYFCCIVRLFEIVIYLFSMLFFVYIYGLNISFVIL